ncbi:MAG: YtxH domain-containing protein [Candidatus Promineifilaceae bacterium]
MNKVMSFLAGSICGAIVGATAALLLAPSSGENLRADVSQRWQDAKVEARLAMEETRRELENQFAQMQRPS